MKRRWMIVTGALAAGILAAGVLLLPVVYAVVFDAKKTVYEEEALPEELLYAPERFMDRFRYPLSEETERLPEEEREIHVNDCRFLRGPELYEKAFGLVGLEEEKSYWDTLSRVRGDNLFLIQTQVKKGGEDYFLSAAMSEELIPFLICCKSGREPSEAEAGEAVGVLEEICRTEMDRLCHYVEEIDGIYETCQEYRNRVRDLYVSLLTEKELGQEIGEEVPLWDCCVRGEWQVCADHREAVLVCRMGQADLVLYYDAAERDFCGYRIQFGDAW